MVLEALSFKKRCSETLPDGSPCPGWVAWRLGDYERCYFHSTLPALLEKKHEQRLIASKKPRRKRLIHKFDIRSLEDLRKDICKIRLDYENGRLSPEQVDVLLKIDSAIYKTLESSELSKRIEEVEKILDEITENGDEKSNEGEKIFKTNFEKEELF